MRVLLISANTERINMPTLPLGLASVAMAARNAGHEVSFLDLMTREDVEAVIKEPIEGFNPDVVGISVRNIDDQFMDDPGFLLEQVKEVVERCRRYTDGPIVLGGAGYSMYPKSALDYLRADMGIQGEGEVPFVTLLERMQTGADPADTPGLHLPGRDAQAKRHFVKNLDELSFPIDDLWLTSSALEDEEFWLPFQTRRGCPMDCSYCSTATIEGRIFRKRSPNLVVKEIARLAKKGFNRFHFVDNTFNLPVSYARELCRLLAEAELDIAYRCILYPWKVDEELVKLMVKGGCREVALGFESGYGPVLQSFNKQFDTEEVRRISDPIAGRARRNQGVSGRKPDVRRFPESRGGQGHHWYSHLPTYTPSQDRR
jgi:radical SAM superfamily enzyme YgiQ (UPF0313 family)